MGRSKKRTELLKLCGDLKQHINGDRTKKVRVAKFVGVSTMTIERWIKGVFVPNGIPLLRLRMFLFFVCGVPFNIFREREQNPAYIATMIIVFSDVTLEDLRVALDYRNTNAVLVICHGEIKNLPKAKINALADIYSQNKNVIKSGVDQLRKLGFNAENAHKFPVIENSPIVQSQIKNDDLVKITGHCIMAIVPLLEVVASDSFSDEDRVVFRDRVGRDILSRFTDLAVAVSGKSARQQILKGE